MLNKWFLQVPIGSNNIFEYSSIAGNPGVFQLYPYPYPPNPYPWPGVQVLAGMGKGMEGLVGLVNFIG